MSPKIRELLDGRKSLLLDMDGTLLDLAYDNHFWLEQFPAAIAERRGWSLVDTKREIAETLAEAEGTLAWYSLDHWGQKFSIDVQALKREDPSRIRFADKAREFLQRARRAGFHLPLVTNAHPDLIALKHEHTGVLDFVDEVYCSHDAGMPKEDPGFWHWLRDAMNSDLSDALMFDDSQSVLQTASGFVDVVAIAKPDSRLDARDMAPHATVDLIGDLDALRRS